MIEIEATINLQNYESIRVRVQGEDPLTTKRLLEDTLKEFGNNDENIHKQINSYVSRVLLPKQEKPENLPCKPCEAKTNAPCENCIDDKQLHCSKCGQLIDEKQAKLTNIMYTQILCKDCAK